jgi:hypothetical protein
MDENPLNFLDEPRHLQNSYSLIVEYVACRKKYGIVGREELWLLPQLLTSVAFVRTEEIGE